MAEKTNPKCYKCGSTDVLVDAWGKWDNEKQEFVIYSTQDNAYCNNCDGQTKLTWVITQDA